MVFERTGWDGGRGFMSIAAVVAAGLGCVLVPTSFALGQKCTPARLIDPAGAALDSLGAAVAIDGDTAIIGAPKDSFCGNGTAGTAHIYRWGASGWAHEATLVAPDGGRCDHFGWAVALSGNSAAVGGAGSVYIFVRSPATGSWVVQGQFTNHAGGFGDGFGESVTLAGDWLVVGASRDDIGAKVDQGSAYLFTRSGTAWAQTRKFTAGDGAAGDCFGQSVSMSADWVVIGAPRDDVGTAADQGSAYVFSTSWGGWTQHSKIIASDGAASDFFGYSTGLSGDYAIVGAYRTVIGSNAGQGAAYIYERGATGWVQAAKLVASDGFAHAAFGWSVSISGDSALIGAPLYGGVSGAAYAFVRSGGVWSEQAKFTPPDGEIRGRFGTAAALHQGRALVGAFTDDIGANTDQGSAWVFTRCGTRWVDSDLQLVGADSAAGDYFGSSIAISGNTALIGAYAKDLGSGPGEGAVYVFQWSGGSWRQQARLVASDGAPGDYFGCSVAIDGDMAIVGAYLDDVGANTDQGSAYVFYRSGSWSQIAKLVASDGAAQDHFGLSVAVSGETAVVGAPLDNVGANTDQGSAYVFTRSGATVVQQARLNGAGGAAGDQFGWSVALDGNTVLAGAYQDDVGANVNQGSAYIFTRPLGGSTWAQQAQLTAQGGAAQERFGISAALDQDTALIGASWKGAAYVFRRSGVRWLQEAQLTSSDNLSGDNFGISASLSGEIAVVGAYYDNVGSNTQQGSAAVFVRNGLSWHEQGKLIVPDGAAGDIFGVSAAVGGTTALIGAQFDDVSDRFNQGSAWSFDLSQRPVIETQAVYGSVCPMPGATFSVSAWGIGGLAYQWQVESPAGSGLFTDLGGTSFNEPATGLLLNYSGAATATLQVSSAIQGGHPSSVVLRCGVSNWCGPTVSNSAVLRVCASDFNCSGGATVQDIFDFLAAYFAGDPRADFNGSGVISVQDIFDFLAAYFAGCP